MDRPPALARTITAPTHERFALHGDTAGGNSPPAPPCHSDVAKSSSAASGLRAFNPRQERIRQLTVISDIGDIRIDVFRNGTIPILLASRFALFGNSIALLTPPEPQSRIHPARAAVAIWRTSACLPTNTRHAQHSRAHTGALGPRVAPAWWHPQLPAEKCQQRKLASHLNDHASPSRAQIRRIQCH